MATMARLEFGRLTQAWQGEASDFTPLLAEQLDVIGSEIGVDLASVGESEVLTTGGRRIDIVARGEDGAEFVVENQYGRADHDHLTRGLAYAVARRARGLIVIAEEHRDEFRAVAQYLNEMAELDQDRGIAIWLVEARAVRIENSAWAPLFSTVVEPNVFTKSIEQVRQSEGAAASLDDFWELCVSSDVKGSLEAVLDGWATAGHRRRLGPNHVVLEAAGPSVSGVRTVVALYADGRVMVPFSSYAGQNSGIAIDSLTGAEFRATADALFGFKGSERQARTEVGWLTPERVQPLLEFCIEVAEAYAGSQHLTPTGESAFDQTRLHRILDAIPEGRWTTYGDLGEVVGTTGMALGSHVKACSRCANAHRILDVHGEARPGFAWTDPSDARTQREVLEKEGVEFTAGRANLAQRISVADLGVAD